MIITIILIVAIVTVVVVELWRIRTEQDRMTAVFEDGYDLGARESKAQAAYLREELTEVLDRLATLENDDRIMRVAKAVGLR